ncbi:MAG: hypothetical protein AAGK97_02440 [Bacteroidota bacterium]
MTTLEYNTNKNYKQKNILDILKRIPSKKSAPSKGLKIAIVSPYPPSKGTLNEYAYHLVEQLKLKEEIAEITILSDELLKGQAYPTFDRNSKVKIIPCWKFNDCLTPIKLRKAIKRAQPDLIFYNIQFLSFGDHKIPAAIGLLCPLLDRIFKIPSVVLLHNIVETVDYASAGITKNKWLQRLFNFTGTMLTKLLLSADLVAVTMGKYVNILEE